MDGTTSLPDRYLSWPTVRHITGLSRTTVWRLQRAGTFPRAAHISPGRVAWRESEVTAWLERQAPRPPADNRSRRQPRAPSNEAETVQPQMAPDPTAIVRKPGAVETAPRRRGRTKPCAGQLTLGF